MSPRAVRVCVGCTVVFYGLLSLAIVRFTPAAVDVTLLAVWLGLFFLAVSGAIMTSPRTADPSSGHPPTRRHLRAVGDAELDSDGWVPSPRATPPGRVAVSHCTNSPLASPQGLSDDPATSDAWLVAEGLRGGDDANAPMAVEPLPAAPDTTSPVSGAQTPEGAT